MDDLAQKLGPEFEKANVLSISEVAHLMKRIKEEDPDSRVFHQVHFEKIYQYVERFNSFKDFDVTFQVRKLLESYEFPGDQKFDNLEIALLSNLCPENAEQARALIPSLARLGSDELLTKMCEELRKLKRLSSGNMNFASTPAWSLSPRLRTSTHTSSPGPGAYTLPSTFSRSPQFSFGIRPKRDESNDSPGPGAYYQKAEYRPSSPVFTMGSRRKGATHAAGESPGPGAYYSSAKRTSVGSSFSIQGKRHEPKSSSDSPGPGHYDISGFAALRDRPRTAVMRGPTSIAHSSSVSDAPGPGEYDPSLSPSGPRWGFGQSPKLKPQLSDSPSPGSYNLPSYMRRGGFTLGKRLTAPTDPSSTPGPGAYSPIRRGDSPTFRIAQSPRKAKMTVSPGPGAYHYQDRPSSPSFSMRPLTPLVGEFAGRDSPGPGAYALCSQIGKNCPGFSLAGKNYRKIDRSQSPGPGHYSSSSRSHSPSYPFPKEPRISDTLKGAPGLGPGQYYSPFKPLPPHWGFGSEERIKPGKTNSPGPGHYDIKPTVPDPAWRPSSKR